MKDTSASKHDPLLLNQPGHREFLLGNEAIVRGALEAGVSLACGYPGTPSSEITDSFARIADPHGIEFEYSVNEKVALEVAFGASLAGARAIVAMKHLGLMYAGDPLSTIPYVGTVGGLVIASAGDPSCRTSPNEQDQRRLGESLHIPVLDPATPQQALDMTRFAFELSEKSRLPVLLRPTTWVCHARAEVTYGELQEPPKARFKRDPGHFVPVPAIARKLRVEVSERLQLAEQLLAESGLFTRQGEARIAIIAAGTPAALCADLIDAQGMGDSLSLLSLGAVFPIPEQWMVEQLRGLEQVLVVEELSPMIEDRIRVLCSLHDLKTRVLGKRTKHFPEAFEYTPGLIQEAVNKAFGLKSGRQQARANQSPTARINSPAIEPAPRPPILCPACPHRSTFFAARSAFGEDTLYFNDIGCYTLGFGPPLDTADASLCMGAAFSMAAGVTRVTGNPTIGFLGDSTFLHSGMPPLLNAVKEGLNMVGVILDNEVTAMTGFQESPGVVVDKNTIRRTVDFEEIVKALGVKHVETVDPNNLAGTIGAFRRAWEAPGVSVVISSRPCPVFARREGVDKAGINMLEPKHAVTGYAIDHDLCGHCGRESHGGRCSLDCNPAIERSMTQARSLEVGTETERPEVAACAAQCPLYLCIQGYSGYIAAGKYAEALELIMERLPLPDVVCRVCNHPCESACIRNTMDQPVAINDLKRFVVNWANSQEEFPWKPTGEPDNGMQVAVVGAGPAGLAAAFDLRMRGYGVSLYDAGEEPGGLLLNGIPSYRLPLSALRRDVTRILATGVEFRGKNTLGKDLSLQSLLDDFDAVQLCIGSYQSLSVDIPGCELPIINALDYLDQVREPGQAPEGARVVVIGGGDAAVDAARSALRNGAQEANIVCLEDRSQMPAIESEIEDAEQEGVLLHPQTRVKAGSPGGLILHKVHLAGSDVFSPERCEEVPGTETRMSADLVIMAIGQLPEPQALNGSGPELEWQQNYLHIDRTDGSTSHPGIFAAGDVIGSSTDVTQAIASGLRAAWGIDCKLRSQEQADQRPPPPPVVDDPPIRKGIVRSDLSSRQEPPRLPLGDLRKRPDEVVGVLSETQARKEAARCMICGLCATCRACLDHFGCPAFYLDAGQVQIDQELCVACGVCAQFCPNGAIQPVITDTSGETIRA